MENNESIIESDYETQDTDAIHVLDLLQNIPLLQQKVMALDPQLLEVSEYDLESRLGHKNTQLIKHLRFAFWQEYKMAQANKKRMRLGVIIHDICTKPTFHKVIDDPVKLAYLVCPPADMMMVQLEFLDRSMKRLRESLELPLIEVEKKSLREGPAGSESYRIVRVKKVNVALIREIRAVAEMMMNRIHGAVTQKHAIESKSLNVNVGTNNSAIPDAKEFEKLHAMEKRLEAMLSKVDQALIAAPPTITVEVVDDDIPDEIT
jgi:hypothetical protein